MTTPATPWWSDRSVWLWGLRAVAAGVVLADISAGRPAPGLSGEHLALLVGIVVAVASWLVWFPAHRLDQRVNLVLLAVGTVGGAVASVVAPNGPALVLPAAVAMQAGSYLPLLWAAGVTASGLAALGVGSIAVIEPGFSLLGSALAVVGGLLVGLWRHQYLLRAEQAELVAVQTRRAQAEHSRAQVLDERTRIAREIHDILAHTLGGLVVQLDAAEALLGDQRDIERGRELVEGARRLAVQGLDETRRAISALRADPPSLPEALADLAAAGSGVRHEINGQPRPLPPDAGLALYRTAQEALANARKHAPGAPVTMTLSFEDHAATLRVINPLPPGLDDGHPTLAATGGGYGLSGLAERAALLGGSLHAGPDQDGWTVSLRLPT
ncbi:MAG: histidine kinase [Actinomycetota bacterium]|nr:histidine kinase [Actinomycetota bacterium]